MTLFNNNTFSCVATFVQMAGIAALTGPDEPVRRMNEIFRQRRDRFVNGLNAPRHVCTLPEGAFYAFPNVTADHARRQELAKFLLRGGRRGVRRRFVFGRGRQRLPSLLVRRLARDIDWALEQMAKVLPHFKA